MIGMTCAFISAPGAGSGARRPMMIQLMAMRMPMRMMTMQFVRI
jgi:hypothetical protein